MELSTITQWNSIGKEMYQLGDVQHEVDRANTFRQSQLMGMGTLRRIKNEIDKQELEQSNSDHVMRYIRRFFKGFLIGWGGKTAFMLLPALLKTRGSFSKIRTALARVVDRDQTSMGLFLGSYLCVFHYIMRILRNDTGYVGKYRAVVAAFIASYTIRVTPRPTQVAVGSFLIIRSFDIMVRYLAQTGYFGTKLASWNHWDVALMSVASCQVIWAGMLNPSSVSKAYMSFLMRQSGVTVKERVWFASVLKGKADMALLGGSIRVEHAIPITLTGPPFSQPPFDVVPSKIVHCFEGTFKRAIPVYLPVYLIPLVLFRTRHLLRRPLMTLLTAAIGLTRSSVFLSSYVSVTWAMLAVLVKQFPLAGIMLPVITGLFSGLTLLIEKKGRRIEIALYVLGHAYQSFFRTWNGLFPAFKHPGQILLAVACAGIMYVYTRRPELIRPSYFRPLNYVFGSDFASWARVTSVEEAYLSSIDLPSLIKKAEEEEGKKKRKK